MDYNVDDNIIIINQCECLSVIWWVFVLFLFLFQRIVFVVTLTVKTICFLESHHGVYSQSNLNDNHHTIKQIIQIKSIVTA